MSEGSRAPSPLQILVRFGLGALAFLLLWRFPEPVILGIPSDAEIGRVPGYPLSTLLVQVVVGAVAGAVFALAARPVFGDWSYRWQLPVALGLLPGAALLVQVLVFAGILNVSRQGVVRTGALFLISSFSLRVCAVLLGVAAAQGVVSETES